MHDVFTQNTNKKYSYWVGEIYSYIWGSLVHVGVYVATHMQMEWFDPQGKGSYTCAHCSYFGLDITLYS